jgi:hypothetical protein
VTGLRRSVLILVMSLLRVETSLFFWSLGRLCHCAHAHAVYDVIIRTKSAVIICHWVFAE